MKLHCIVGLFLSFFGVFFGSFLAQSLTSVFGHVDVGGEVGRNDGVEKDEDAQRQPEEQADDREEEGLRPGRVHVCGAAGVGGVLLVVGDGEDGGGEEDGETPGDEADQSGLSEEISRLCSHWSSSYFTGLSLVETFIVMLRQLSYAIKTQLKASKAPTVSSWHKDSWLPCKSSY